MFQLYKHHWILDGLVALVFTLVGGIVYSVLFTVVVDFYTLNISSEKRVSMFNVFVFVPIARRCTTGSSYLHVYALHLIYYAQSHIIHTHAHTSKPTIHPITRFQHNILKRRQRFVYFMI